MEAKSTVLVKLSVPKIILVIEPVVDKVIVALAETSTGAVNTKLEPTVKLHALEPSPTTILELVGDTVQFPLRLTLAAFLILKILLAVVKFDGAAPVPSVFSPQLDVAFILPVPL